MGHYLIVRRKEMLIENQEGEHSRGHMALLMIFALLRLLYPVSGYHLPEARSGRYDQLWRQTHDLICQAWCFSAGWSKRNNQLL
jgi:hypothetical protein